MPSCCLRSSGTDRWVIAAGALASAPAAMTHLSVPEERKKQLDITPNLVRISIGVEDADDLIADFANALEAV